MGGGEGEGFGAACCALAAPVGLLWSSVRVLAAVGSSPAALRGWKYPDQTTSATGAWAGPKILLPLIKIRSWSD